MPNENKATEGDIFGARDEGTPLKDDSELFASQEVKIPASSPEEKEMETPAHQGDEGETKVEPKGTDDDKPIPFHKHPRWLAREERLNELEAKLAQYEAKPQGDAPTPPSEFVELFGNDPQVWAKYNQFSERQKQDWKNELLSELQQQQQQQLTETRKWDLWVDNQLEELRDEGKAFKKNELLKVIGEYKPTDADGNLDFRKGYELYEKLQSLEKNPEKDNKRKQIAGATASESGAEAEKPKFATPGIRKVSLSDYLATQ